MVSRWNTSLKKEQERRKRMERVVLIRLAPSFASIFAVAKLY